MYLFIDHEKSIKAQESQGTLRTPTHLHPYTKGMNVNFLSIREQKQRLEGPEKDRVQLWWKDGTTKECMLSA
eukprot:317826-Prorocentrum_lima.AAC.1